MTVSQNGWAIHPPLSPAMIVNGVSFGGVHTGDAYIVLHYVATRYDTDVEALISGTCGCYNPRLIPGSRVWSNHASATAIDCNWARHPLGARGTYKPSALAAIRRILAYCDGVIRWGGDFTNVDEMHFEINKPAAAVTALARKIEATMDEQSIASKLGADLNTDASGVAKGVVRQVDRALADNFAAVTTRLDTLEGKLDQILAAIPPAGLAAIPPAGLAAIPPAGIAEH